MAIPSFFPALSMEGVTNSLLSIEGLTSFLALISILLILKKTLFNSSGSRPPLPPGPKPWPFIGSAHHLLMCVFTKKPFYHWVNEAMAKGGHEIFCIRLGKIHIITISCPDIACEFFKKHDAEFSSRPVILSSEVVSEGYSGVILTPQNDHWKKLRRIMAAHVLSPAAHDWMQDKRDQESDHIVRYVYNLVKGKGGVVDLRVVTQHYCGNLIKRLLFNKRYFGEPDMFGGPGVDDLEHVDAVLKIFKYTYSFCVSDYLPIFRYRYDLDGQEKIIRGANSNVRKYQDPEIDARIKQWKEGKKSGGNDDILDMLINLKDEEQLTTVQIKALLLELTAAGIDNPSNAIEWVIDEMLKQPYMFEKASEELDRVVGRDRLVEESDLGNLPFIRALVKESFRLHPFAPFNLPHMSSHDTTVAGYFIPKGSQVLLSRPGLGRNPKTWDDPFLFKPERYLNEAPPIIFNDPDLLIFSFSIGRRGCPGVRLGSLISVMLLARLLQAFTWHPPSDAPYVCCVEGDTDLLPSKNLVARAKLRLDEKLFHGLLKE